MNSDSSHNREEEVEEEDSYCWHTEGVVCDWDGGWKTHGVNYSIRIVLAVWGQWKSMHPSALHECHHSISRLTVIKLNASCTQWYLSAWDIIGKWTFDTWTLFSYTELRWTWPASWWPLNVWYRVKLNMRCIIMCKIMPLMFNFYNRALIHHLFPQSIWALFCFWIFFSSGFCTHKSFFQEFHSWKTF